jgi:hypothetical protein
MYEHGTVRRGNGEKIHVGFRSSEVVDGKTLFNVGVSCNSISANTGRDFKEGWDRKVTCARCRRIDGMDRLRAESKITRVGESKISHPIMEISSVSADGTATYIERTVENYLWACDCGLIWQIRWHAESCEDRHHVASWEQHYGGYTENGVHKGGTSYPRQAAGKLDKRGE